MAANCPAIPAVGTNLGSEKEQGLRDAGIGNAKLVGIDGDGSRGPANRSDAADQWTKPDCALAAGAVEAGFQGMAVGRSEVVVGKATEDVPAVAVVGGIGYCCGG